MPARLVQVTLRNNTSDPVRWITDGLDHGEWQDPWYPSRHGRIEPGQEGTWRSESAGILTGTEGWAWFAVDAADGTQFARIKWSRPYVGNFGFELGVTRNDPTVPDGSSTFTDTTPVTVQLVPIFLTPLGSGQENIIGQLLAAGIITPVGALWSGTGPGHHVRFGVAVRNRTTVASPLIHEPGRRVRVVAAHSGKVLDVLNGSLENLTPIVQFDWHGGDNQRWIIHDLGGGEFRLVAANSGKVLDVFEGRQENLTHIFQYDWHGGAMQRWRMEDVGDGLSRIVAVHSGKVLDVLNGSHDNFARLVQFDWHGGPNQRWRLEDV
jgi:hypothetical protein